MPDQSERLRRISHYSWHVLRADSQRQRALRSRDPARGLHMELAQLHMQVAIELSDAWRPVSDKPRIGEPPEARIQRIYDSLLAALEEPAQGKAEPPPSTVMVEMARIT